MKRVIGIFLAISIFVISGCTYNPNIVNDEYYVPYTQGLGFVVNQDQPTVVFNDNLVVPLIADYHLYGDWLAAFPDADYKITFGEDNVVYFEDEPFAEWVWLSPNVLIMNRYDGSEPTALRFDYIEGTTDYVQFTEYYNNGDYFPFLAVHVD